MSYKINFNRKKLSDQEIQSHMDFGKFMQGKAAASAGGSFLAGAKAYVIVAVSGLVILGGYLTYKGLSKARDEFSNVSFINPPFAGAGVKSSVFNISTQMDTALVYKTGSTIVVPANAFLDKDKKPVKGTVELRYREFHTPCEILLSGIPMHYDSAGERYQFESAGMLEVLAYKDGQLLYANPDAPIRINMLSYNNEDKFNVYYLDTVKERWEYKEKNSSVLGNRKPLYDDRMAKQYLQEAIKELEAQMPQKATPGRNSFVIDYNKNEFPELAMFDSVKFEVDPGDKDYSPHYAQKIWQDVSISKGQKEASYTITFSNESESHSFAVKPVLEGLKYDDVKKEMEGRLIDYQIALQKGKMSKRQKQDLLMQRYEQAVQLVQWDNINGYVDQYLKQDRVDYVALSARTFKATVFGVWNLDVPLSIRMAHRSFNATVKGSDGMPLVLREAWVIEPDDNMIMRFEAPRDNSPIPMRYNPSTRCLMVGRTEGNKIAYITCDEFNKAVRTGDSPVFTMKVEDKKIKEAEELKTLLNL